MPLVDASSARSVVIAGAGGFGLEVFEYLYEESLGGGPNIAGFIDDAKGRQPAGIDLPNLGTTWDYRPLANQVVVVALGSVEARQNVIMRLAERGIQVPTYIHGSVLVSSTARVGRSAVICPFSIVNRNTTLGDGVLVNVQSNVAHGASVGDYSVLSPGVILNGDAAVGARCFLGTRATIYPGVKIGANCIVDSHTGVSASSADNKFITSGLQQVTARRIPA
ncbi:UDP-N-acetylbacillosamine N-acetyltransferase [Cupriavidus yeoncheonensis]|uniref:UDP-N-acetylbacillosamine N-acetyltransferase n=1 Tax=Cupriavidus yeoncheonensis TaxID=1462994 RepID=A0A916N0K5_9BURK|nr:acetyltransferase [Cupriavidus yeoncheonensis]CAG2156964.1 UDP-N-acetylbacillosamine N-acetyltransferase [Cupriavidus yeoncheonensis]